MKMFFGFLAAAIVGISVAAPARAVVNFAELQDSLALEAHLTAGLNWKVGDKANYNIDLGGLLKGTVVAEVTKDTGTGFWFTQDIDLQIQKQKVEVLINKSNGQIEKILMNGKEQEIPKNESEIVEMKEDKVTVPLGSFDAIHAKIKDKKTGEISDAWVNPKICPLTGILKSVGNTQLGKITQEATACKFVQR
jgi:hypothetical protein